MSKNASLNLTISGNASGFSQVVRQVKKEAEELQHSFTMPNMTRGIVGGIAGSFAFEGVKSFFEGLMEKGKDVQELSEQFDVSTTAVQQWQRALAKAGLGTMVFTRALDALRNKRQEALEDDKKMSFFSKLGLREDAESGMSAPDLLKKVLSRASRTELRQLLGPRAEKLRAAMGYMKESSNDLSESEVESVHDVALASEQHPIKRALQKQVTGTMRIMANALYNMLHGKDSSMIGSAIDLAGMDARADARREEEANKTREESEELARKSKDQRDAAYHAKEAERIQELHETSGKSLEEARRRNMSPGERQASLLTELREVRSKITDEKLLRAMGVPVNSDSEKELLKLQAREEQLKTELRQKPGEFGADSLTKAGLITAPSLGMGIQDIGARQLATLQSIEVQMRQLFN